MLYSGRGIVLGFIKYGDSSVIAHIYTHQHGMCAFIIQGAFRKKAKISASQLQPFTVLEMVYYHRENKQIQNIKEARANPPLNALQMNVVKSGLALFGTEVLQKCLKNFERDEQLFELLYHTIIELNNAETISPFWPHYLLLALAQKLGFAPSMESEGRFFHLKEGVFTNIPLSEREITTPDETQLLLAILNQREPLFSNKSLRNALLDKLLVYFAHHVGSFGDLKSLAVLRNIMQ